MVVLLEILCGYFLGKQSTWAFFDPKFIMGLFGWGFIWAMYLCSNVEDRYKVVAEFTLTAILVFGMDLVVLSMLQTMGAAGFFGLLTMVGFNVYFTTILFPKSKPRKGTDEGTIKAKNIYENLLCDMWQVWTIFIGQCVLLVFLVYSCYYNFEEKQDDPTYSFWLAAYISVQMSGFFKRGDDSQVGRTWDVEKWRGIESANESVEYFQPTKKEGGVQLGEWVRMTPDEMWWRGRMGFLVNTCFRDVVMFITPILCMQSSDAVDFVQNCFALSYITTLDDISDAVEIKWRNRQQGLRTNDVLDPKLHAIVAVKRMLGRKLLGEDDSTQDDSPAASFRQPLVPRPGSEPAPVASRFEAQ